MQELVVYAAKSKKVMYSITFVILPVTKTIFCTRGCFSASLGLKMNIDSLSWPYGHLRLSNLSFPALVTLENNHSYQKLFPTLGKWQMNEVKYYCCVSFSKAIEDGMFLCSSRINNKLETMSLFKHQWHRNCLFDYSLYVLGVPSSLCSGLLFCCIRTQ